MADTTQSTEGGKRLWAWEEVAQRGGTMPEGLHLEDQLAFQAMRHLYSSFRHKAVTKEQAGREKRAIYSQWRSEKEKRVFSDRLTAHHVKMWKYTEQYRSAYLKNRCLENADLLEKAIDGIIDESKKGFNVEDK